MAASEELLGLLHNIVAEDLIRRIRGIEVKNEAGEVTGVIAASASDIANAIKRAREMALLPYTVPVVSSRGGRNRG